MEKITLKPVAKELLFRNDEADAHADVLTYTGANAQEKMLGSLYLVGHVAYEEEDLGYIVSLVSSLAKREYYSEQSIRGQDPKKAFEHALNKLNEVLEDFFRNKKFSLNLGLAAIAGDQLYISKLGKFKVGLARKDQYIDVLNNLSLFQKSDQDEHQFSNIISGKLYPGDKIFAYYPSRPVTSREKSLQTTFLKENQSNFTEKIATLANMHENFMCCGLHLAIEQIKEIPIESLPSYEATDTPQMVAQAARQEREVEAPASDDAAAEALSPTVLPKMRPQPASSQQISSPRAKVIAAELSVSKKDTMIGSFAGAAKTLGNLNKLPAHKKLRGFIVVALIVLVPLFAVALIRGAGESSSAKAAFQEATDNLKLAQAKIAENESREARALIISSIEKIGTLDSKKATSLKTDLQTALDSVDHASSAKPEMIGDLTASEQELLTNNFHILQMKEKTPSVWFNNSEILTISDGTPSKSISYTLKDPATAKDAFVYEKNLYTLSANHIYKYANALDGSTKRSEWGHEQSHTLISIAADGNIYGLTQEGSIVTYFKGEQKGSLTINIPIDEKSRIFAPENTKSFYIANLTMKRVYLLDKSTGAIQVSYKLDELGEIKDITVSNDGNVWVVSEDNKLYLFTGVLQ